MRCRRLAAAPWHSAGIIIGLRIFLKNRLSLGAQADRDHPGRAVTQGPGQWRRAGPGAGPLALALPAASQGMFAASRTDSVSPARGFKESF
jgi:hypothetical protein